MTWSMLFFSLALSLDGFGVGLSYGMRKISIRPASFMIICLSSAVAVGFSMLLGTMIAHFLPLWLTNVLGALILITVGAWVLLQNYILYLIPERHTYSVRLPSLGLVVNILKEPGNADLDRSGVIDIKEALFLGMALAMDALGAGFGAALAGYSVIWTPVLVAVCKFVLVSAGLFGGRRFFAASLKNELTLLPGGIIMLLGLSRLIRF